MYILKKIITKFLNFYGLTIIRSKNFNKILSNLKSHKILSLLKECDQDNITKIIKYLDFSKSELGQDIFVLNELNFKKNGFFIEFGAADGLEMSNSYLLENNFGWNGILAEPSRSKHKALKENRKSNIETKCVWTKSDVTLTFNEVSLSEFSTIDSYSNNDEHLQKRKNGIKYEVKTISLNDLLNKYNAPYFIDYLSIDTEGSEFEILSSLNFEKYKIKIITCEHNNTNIKDKVFNLLKKNGYNRKFSHLSEYDDWYVLN